MKKEENKSDIENKAILMMIMKETLKIGFLVNRLDANNRFKFDFKPFYFGVTLTMVALYTDNFASSVVWMIFTIATVISEIFWFRKRKAMYDSFDKDIEEILK